MHRLIWDKIAARAGKFSRDERRAASIAAGAHALHDGYTDLIYIMLPLWQAEFGLSYAALGLLRSMFVGAMASLQIPASFLSERLGAAVVLALGTALAGLGYCLAGLSTGFVMLLAALVIGGMGSSTQHPIASALVARAFAGPRSLKALGTYNFCGDLGKMTIPAALSLLLLVMPWRPALAGLGSLGLVMAVVIFLFTPRFNRDASAVAGPARVDDRTPPRSRGFGLLLAIGILDSATRMGFLLFVPFVLKAKGANLQDVGLAMTLIFAGGAAGKLACTFLGARIRRDCHRLGDRKRDRAGHSRVAAAAAVRRTAGTAAHRRRAQRHVLGALRLCTGPRHAGKAHPRTRHFLYRHDRLGRDSPDRVRPRRRFARRHPHAHAGRFGGALDAAARGAVAAGVRRALWR